MTALSYYNPQWIEVIQVSFLVNVTDEIKISYVLSLPDLYVHCLLRAVLFTNSFFFLIFRFFFFFDLTV